MTTDRQIADAARTYVAAYDAYHDRDRDDLLLLIRLDAALHDLRVIVIADALDGATITDTPPL
jgi:hypothetical protein